MRTRADRIRLLVTLTLTMSVLLACRLPFLPSPQPGGGQETAAPASPTVEPPAPTATAEATQPPLPTATQPAPTGEPTGGETGKKGEGVEPAGDLAMVIDSQRNLNLWSAETGLVALDPSGDVVYGLISPDGQVVVYLREHAYPDHSLWSVGSDGSAKQELVPPDYLRGLAQDDAVLSSYPWMISWLPNQPGVFAFNTIQLFDGPGMIPNYELTVVDTHTGSVTELLSKGEGGMFSFSPDGRWIALSKPEGIDIRSADGELVQADVLTFPYVMTYSEYYYHPNVMWAADSGSFVVAIPPQDSMQFPDQPTVVYKVSMDGITVRELGVVLTSPLRFPDLEPGLRRIAYLRETAPGSNLSDLFITNLTDFEENHYATGVTQWWGWLADGEQFVYSSLDPSPVMVGRVGSMPLPLSDQGQVAGVYPLPSGKFLLLTHGAEWGLYLAEPGEPAVFVQSLGSGDRTPFIRPIGY